VNPLTQVVGAKQTLAQCPELWNMVSDCTRFVIHVAHGSPGLSEWAFPVLARRRVVAGSSEGFGGEGNPNIASYKPLDDWSRLRRIGFLP